jgi:monosaccharide-transporting ATPase
MERGDISAFNLDIYRGEVLGFAGLLGSVRTEIAKLLFGIDKPKKGVTFLKSKKVSITLPKKAINHFFAFCP